MTGPDVLNVLDVNLAGVVRTTTAFLPLLRRSADPVIINVSSAMGSLDAIVGLAAEGPGHGSGRFVDRDGEIKWS